jgi:hypothetical protein
MATLYKKQQEKLAFGIYYNFILYFMVNLYLDKKNSDSLKEKLE